MKIFGKDCLLAEASIDNAGSVVISALAVGALYSFYNNEPAIYINDEDFDVTLLSEVLNDLLLEFVPWKGAIPNTELSEPIEGYEIQCRGAYEPLTQGYCIEVGYLRPTNSYDLYDDGSVIYHMQTHYEALDSDYARGNQLFATVKDAEHYLLNGDYKDYNMEPASDLPFVCHNQGMYHTMEVEDSGEETYRTYNFTYWRYRLGYGWSTGFPEE